MKIVNTRNYRLFDNDGENRPLDVATHKNLMESMKEYGFLPCFPIIAVRDGTKLIVKDGQHRLAIAEALSLPVYYIEAKTDFDIAKINSTSKNWIPRDYARKFATNGVAAYQEGLEFANEHKLALTTAFSLLAGTIQFSNCQLLFYSGAFKVKDREYADRVAGLYGPLIKLSPALRKNTRLLEACMAVCRVEDFDAQRLLRNASRCAEKLMAYSTREAYLDMLEDVYNFRHQKLVGLKAAATMVMRQRNAVEQRKAESAAKRQNGN